MGQWKHAGPITLMSVDRKHTLIDFFQCLTIVIVIFCIATFVDLLV